MLLVAKGGGGCHEVTCQMHASEPRYKSCNLANGNMTQSSIQQVQVQLRV